VTRYELLLALHVLAAIVWIGGALMIQLFAILADRSRDPARMATFAKDAELVGMRLFAPTGLVLFIVGILLVLDGPWNFSMLWVDLGLAAYALSFLSGLLFIGPESGRIGKLIEERGAADPEVQRRIARIFMISRVELAILALIVFDMVAKPTRDDVGTLVVGALVLVTTGALAFVGYGRRGPLDSAAAQAD
jgi:uncharacterized membrane protein